MKDTQYSSLSKHNLTENEVKKMVDFISTETKENYTARLAYLKGISQETVRAVIRGQRTDRNSILNAIKRRYNKLQNGRTNEDGVSSMGSSMESPQKKSA